VSPFAFVKWIDRQAVAQSGGFARAYKMDDVMPSLSKSPTIDCSNSSGSNDEDVQKPKASYTTFASTAAPFAVDGQG